MADITGRALIANAATGLNKIVTSTDILQASYIEPVNPADAVIIGASSTNTIQIGGGLSANQITIGNNISLVSLGKINSNINFVPGNYGVNVDTSLAGDGGGLELQAGFAALTGTGGRMLIEAGAGGDTDGASPGGAGGEVEINAREGGNGAGLNASGVGGAVTIRAGDGGIGGVDANGGDVTITGGHSNKIGGSVYILGGDFKSSGGALTNSGGNVYLAGGDIGCTRRVGGMEGVCIVERSRTTGNPE